MRRGFGLAVAVVCVVLAPGQAKPPKSPADATEFAFAAAKHDGLNALAAFLRAFPKGADLHNHLGGAIYAESYIGWAAEQGLCVDTRALALAKPPCDGQKGLKPVAEFLRQPDGREALMNAFSMRSFAGGSVADHDQFFATFGRFGTSFDFPAAVAEVAARAEHENILHLELMSTFGSSDVWDIASKLQWTDDFDAFAKQARDNGLDAAVAHTRATLDADSKTVAAKLGCDKDANAPGCHVDIEYLAQLNRMQPNAVVFVQALLGAELARSDPRVLGINIVAPEDSVPAIENYATHMRIIAYATKGPRPPHVALHAGELTLKLAPPEVLNDHIRQAVEIGHAERIGHGSDIAYELGADQLLQEMKQRHVAVELALTSNQQILGLDAGTSPFRLYRRAGVPIALSTDDAGVERTTLTVEYAKAAIWFDLSYRDMKKLSIDSLRYSFLPGQDLWNEAEAVAAPCAHDAPGGTASTECAAFLKENRRAALEWDLLARISAFERVHAK